MLFLSDSVFFSINYYPVYKNWSTSDSKHRSLMLMNTWVFICVFPLFLSQFVWDLHIRYFFFNLACLKDKYGNDCEYTCGHCYNNASCDRNDGTCSNGCEKGYRGSDCKQREYFIKFHTIRHRIILDKIYLSNIFIDWW